MGDNFEQMSSQESLFLSQDTLQFMWDELSKSMQFTSELNVENLPSASGIQAQGNSVKLETEEEMVVSSSMPHKSAASVSCIPYVPSSLPACQTWPGEYDFGISFAPQEKNTKSAAWLYSGIKDKLYVRKDVPCPVNFSANTVLQDLFIRVTALYTSPEQASEVVQRCVNHSMEEIKKGVYEAEHLVRCESSRATYHIDSATRRHSVVVPFENPPAGQQYSTYLYKFTCFGSCAGGPNRRPLMLIFTLEKENLVVGRRRLDLKICACPGRDRKTDEKPEKEQTEKNSACHVSTKRKEPRELVGLSDAVLPPKKIKVSYNQEYSLNVEDKKCHEFLLQMKAFYNMCQMLENSPLMHFQKKKTEEREK